MARVVTARAFAKINLGLRVLGRRPDGYHELRTVFQSIDLSDTLTFRASRGPFRLNCTRDDVPVDDRNLVWRAAQDLWAAMGRADRPDGASVLIQKSIPLKAGFGGGSADAAAALLALARLWHARVPASSMERLAAGLGADVPFFLYGGTALGLGRGDEIFPLADLPRSPVVIAFPPFGVPTADAFGWFDADASAAGECGGCVDPAAKATTAVWRPDSARVANDLEPCVVRRHPAIAEVLARLRESGATAAAMSGSGSAVFGLFADVPRATRAAARLSGSGWIGVVTRTLTRREVAVRSRPVERQVSMTGTARRAR